MRSLNNRILFGGLAALVAMSGQIAQAKDGAGANASSDRTVMKDLPTESAETKKPKTARGVTITPFTLQPVNPTVRTNSDVSSQGHRGVTLTPYNTKVTNVKAGPKVPVITKVTTPKSPKTPKPVVVVKPTPPVKNPNGIITVSTKTSATAPFINAWLDRPGNNPKYKVGDKMVVNVSSTVECNVVVFNYDAQNTLTQIFPNEHQKDGHLKGGQKIQIGGEDSPFDYSVSGNGGVERIFVYAYPTTQNKAPLTVAMDSVKQSQSPFRQSNKLPLNEYVAMVRDSAAFTTRGIEVVPRQKAVRTVASSTTDPATDQNKLELTFQVDAK